MTINLTNHAMAITPGPVIAAAYAKACEHFTTTPNMEEFAQRILKNAWTEIQPILTEEAIKNVHGKLCAAITFIDMYFNAQGDWKQMHSILSQNAGMSREGAEHIAQMICTLLIHQAEEMRKARTP